MYSVKTNLAEVGLLINPCQNSDQLNHLLRVADSISLDAAKVWSELWAQIQPQVNPAGSDLGENEAGFVPACGWTEFLEKFFQIKHYLDATRRVCQKKA